MAFSWAPSRQLLAQLRGHYPAAQSQNKTACSCHHGENLDLVATFTKCDLAEKGSHRLSAASMDLALCCSHWPVLLKPAATGPSKRKNLCQARGKYANSVIVQKGRVWGLGPRSLTKGILTITCWTQVHKCQN